MDPDRVLAALLAALAWFIALSHFDLSAVYPFLSLTFVLVLFLRAPFFGEPVTVAKVVGVVLVLAGPQRHGPTMKRCAHCDRSRQAALAELIEAGTSVSKPAVAPELCTQDTCDTRPCATPAST